MTEKSKPAPEPEVDPDNVQLSPEALDRIRKKAAKMVAEERLKALEAAALKAALEEIRGKESMLTGDPVEDELVNFTVNAEFACGRSTRGEIRGPRINGREFEHGKTYTVPRHLARTLMDIIWRTEVNDHAITDKPLAELHRKPRNTAITGRHGAVVRIDNAPMRADGTVAG